MKRALALLLVLFSILAFSSCGKADTTPESEAATTSSSPESGAWPKSGIAALIPAPKSGKIEIHINDDDCFSATVNDFSPEESKEYLSECEKNGFSEEEIMSLGSSTCLFNEEGYKLDISYYNYSKEMHVKIDAPQKLGKLRWPSGNCGKLIPCPDSEKGEVEWENADGFCLYIGDMDIDMFNDYIDACANAGFSVDYERGDTYYYAKNESGYNLSLNYEGFNTVFMRLELLEEDESDSITSEEEKTDNNTEELTEEVTEGITDDNTISGITLDGDNEYFIISDIDTSECTYEDGYYSGMVYFNAHTTQKYIDEYGEYFYREIYFGFYNEDGTLVSDETTWKNCVYNHEYTDEDFTYVIFASRKPITEVKVLKIVLSN